MHNNPGIRRTRKMPTPSKSDPLLLFRVEQLEEDHVSKAEHNLQLQGIQESIDALRTEVKEFKAFIQWATGIFAGAILAVITGLLITFFNKGF
jgi:hypothetical protein